MRSTKSDATLAATRRRARRRIFTAIALGADPCVLDRDGMPRAVYAQTLESDCAASEAIRALVNRGALHIEAKRGDAAGWLEHGGQSDLVELLLAR